MKTKNKKLWALTLALALALPFAACGIRPAGTGAAAPADTRETTEQSTGAFSPDGSVIFQKDGVTVTTAGLDKDPTDGGVAPIIWVDIDNSGSADACLGVSNGSVNGLMADVHLTEYYQEDGEYYGADYASDRVIPALSHGRYALSYYGNSSPGIKLDTLGEMELCFTTAQDEFSWPDFVSEPVKIVTGEAYESVDIAALGTVVVDSDKLLLVVGQQEYDDFFGPMVYAYMENRSDEYIGVSVDSAQADGVSCDYILYGDMAAPGKKSAGFLCFDGEMQAMRGFENLTLRFRLQEAPTRDALNESLEYTALDPVTVTYHPQIWGDYENDGLRLEIQPKYNDKITVEVPENDPDGILFSVSETASLEAGGFEGAGWLFSIAKISEDRLHELLCYDMSGVNVIARDEDGSYYLYCHPTDVRFVRAGTEEMQRDAEQWTALNEWAGSVSDSFITQNGLENASFSNTEVDMYLARAAWDKESKASLSTTEYGPIELGAVDGTPYVEYLLQGWYWEAEGEEAPDGEYVVLSFPDEDLRLDFFFAEGSYVRVVSGGSERLYESVLYDELITNAEVLRGWYCALAEQAGLRAPDESLKAFAGDWYEKIAGRGTLTVTESLAPGKATVEVRWPESAAVADFWTMTAVLGEDGKLRYENGAFVSNEYDENGEEWQIDGDWDLSGELWLEGGELRWTDSRSGDTSSFLRGK